MSQSGYNPGHTIAEVGAAAYQRLWDRARSGGVDDQTAAGVDTFTALQFTLSGGGPGSDIVFLLDAPLEEGGEVREGFYSYYESGGTYVEPFGRTDGQLLLDALLSEPSSEDESDEEEG